MRKVPDTSKGWLAQIDGFVREEDLAFSNVVCARVYIYKIAGLVQSMLVKKNKLQIFLVTVMKHIVSSSETRPCPLKPKQCLPWTMTMPSSCSVARAKAINFLSISCRYEVWVN